MKVDKNRGDRSFAQECDRPSQIFSKYHNTSILGRRYWHGCIADNGITASDRWLWKRYQMVEGLYQC